MSSRMTPRGTAPGVAQQQTYHPAPNAALLIDFDNVTMTIRSDLGKELRTLLNSEVIRGKVAVQRAYADWRRYPQYIVPLAENSVDLIFAPAYGSAKKNATDLRMAIDAIELVFTRPEIGTYILMTGDSDFSSCVLKLKEYGKYVIGVGMRESSSDLLIQNCDEYYSYHSLSGLTRAGEIEESKEDPWVLVKRAVQQMVKNNDVMRTDRLKQVMLDLDPGFDEKKVGYSKFSRFVSEAASKGLLRLRKGENGQYEILDSDTVEPQAEPEKESREKVVERIVAEAEAGNGRRGRGRGRGDRSRDERPREEKPREEKPREEKPREEAAAVSRVEPAAEAKQPESEKQAAAAGGGGGVVSDLKTAYSLLQEAVRRLTGGDTKAVRDGDVKRRMLEITRDFDESKLGFPKFTRFLRQAHDDEVIDLSRAGNGNYEVALPAGGKRLPPPPETAGEAATEAPAKETRKEETRGESPRAEAPAKEAAAAQPAAEKAALGGLRNRRGGRSGASGPPPILPGQAIPSKGAAAAKEEPVKEAAPAAAAAPEAEEEKKPSRSRSRRGRGRTKEPEAEKPAAEAAPEEPKAEEKKAEERKPNVSRSRRGRRSAAADEGPPPILEGQGVASTRAAAKSAPAAKPAAAEKGFDAAALGLPTLDDGIRKHLAGYKGVGAKTADALIETFGTTVFDALQNRSKEVRSLLGPARSKGLLEQWKADYAERSASRPAEEPAAEKKSSGRSRRGGRGSRGRKKEPAGSS